MSEYITISINLLCVIITVIGSWAVARYTAKMDNIKNLATMQSELKKMDTANKFENRRVVNQLILEKGAELSELITEMVRDELYIGTNAVYIYYRTSDPEQKEKARKKALMDLRKAGNITPIKQRSCSILFAYFPEIKNDYKDLIRKYNYFKVRELYCQENKLKNLDNEYSQNAMTGELYMSTVDSYDKELFEIIDKLDDELTKITVEMKNI